MNFLAHAYLSGNDEEIIVGNFIADHVKGRSHNRFSDGILKGIELHRFIDEYTDNHPIVRQSVERLKPSYSRYSPVIVDMFYDHLLACHWKDYSHLRLKKFTNRIYIIMMMHYRILPSKTQRLIPFMMADDWMAGYAHAKGLQKALSGMASRTRFESGMEKAVYDLRKDYDLYLEEFRIFFPEIQARVARFQPLILSPEKTTIQVKTETTSFLRKVRFRNSQR